MKLLEKLFESTLWNGRLFVLLAVIFSMFGSIVLFFVASVDIWGIMIKTFETYLHHQHPEHFHEELVGVIIGAVDLYLMAIVMLIFSFGIYELFISEIDPAKQAEGSKILEIHSLDQLKDKLAKVIVMVLVVSFFKKALYTHYDTPLEMLYFAGAILALAVGLYFLHKGGEH
ncbi:MAG: YqhA family protein [Hydrogenimonas sp.]|nr:MAG: YqhA family protein [Hydrogenimonas sp.]